ncbi:MAG: hypothetical protein WCS09_09705 [Pseudomonadota bacterium]
MNYTAQSIQALIGCPKRIVDPPTKDFKEEKRHRRKDMRLQSSGAPAQLFDVFIRQSLEFAEDFSLGLMYPNPEGKRITLIRYNGQHHQSNDPLDLAKTHFQYHIHMATADNLSQGRYEKHPADPTIHYASFEEATVAFLDRIRLDPQDIARHFPGSDVLPLFQNLPPR